MTAHRPEVPRSLPVFPPMPVLRPADTLSKPFLVATRVKQEKQVLKDGEHTGATPGRAVHGPGRKPLP